MTREDPRFKVAMAIVSDGYEKFLAMHKNLGRTDSERYGKNPWETAGGKVEDDEDPVVAAIREVGEETGLDSIYNGPENYPAEKWELYHSEQDIVFYPVPLKATETDTELQLSEEHDDAEWLTADEFRDRLPEHNVRGFNRVVDEF